MQKTYYRNEYSEKEWGSLVDKAIELGCKIEYNKYGDRLTIDSTEKENALIKQDEGKRIFWAEEIHRIIQDASNISFWVVRPKYKKGFAEYRYKSKEVAEREAQYLEYKTGVKFVCVFNKE